MTEALSVNAYLDEKPAFCFTTDIEWSPEWAIDDLFALADRHRVPLTPFVTHESAAMRKRFADPAERRAAGVHPNFLTGSTHGDRVMAVIDHVTALWPEAVSFRSHCFYDDTRMSREMAARGFLYDSNQCAFLQPGLVPLRTATRIIRFPVFWEDDVHSGLGLEWTTDAIADDLATPGLKIFNVHPLRVALNVPDEDFYQRDRRAFERGEKSASARHAGAGTRTLLEALFAYAREHGHAVVTLDQLYAQAVSRGVPLAEMRPGASRHR